MKDVNVVWHPYPEEKPKKDGEYKVSIKSRKGVYASTAYWLKHNVANEDFWDEYVAAWAELQEPYEEEI